MFSCTLPRLTCLLMLFLAFVFLSAPVKAQDSPDKFFRPVKSTDLVTKLPPRIDVEKNFDRDSAVFTSRDQGCPDEINIGSVDEDADIFGRC